MSNGKSMNRQTMRRFIEAVQAGETPETADLEAIAQAFEGIEAGATPKAALGLNGRPGRPRKRKTVEENWTRLEAAHQVLALQADGARFEDAIANVAAAYNRDDETIRSWLKVPDVRQTATTTRQNMERLAPMIAEADQMIADAEALGIEYCSTWTLRELRQAIEAARPAKG